MSYVLVPNWLSDADISPQALKAYIHLARFGTFCHDTGTYEECRPSIPTLAKRMNVSDRTAQRAVEELVELGAVTRQRRVTDDGANLPSIYRVHQGQLIPPAHMHHPGDRDVTTPGVTRVTTLVSQMAEDQEPNTKNQTPKELPPLSPPRGGKDENKPSRGTRLPDNWEPPIDCLGWAKQKTPHIDVDEQTEAFRDYWHSTPGQRGTKLDWAAAWRNWMRKAQQDTRRQAGPRTQHLVELANGMRVQPKTIEAMERIERFRQLDQAELQQQQLAIGGR